MARIVGTCGSGITEQAIVRFDISSDLKEFIAAANYSMAIERFSSIAKMVSQTAKSILEQHNFPTDVRGSYVISRGMWAAQEAHAKKGPGYQSFLDVLAHFKVPPDSGGGYAAQALVLLDQIQIKMTNSQDEALALIFKLGEIVKEATLKSVWEADALRGEKIQKAAERGDEIAYGSRESRRRKNEALKTRFEALRAEGLKPMAAYRRIAQEENLNIKTIQRKISRI